MCHFVKLTLERELFNVAQNLESTVRLRIGTLERKTHT